NPARGEGAAALPELLRRAQRETHALGLNFFKKATFANSFKWRLLENGVARETADQLTQTLLMHISRNRADPLPSRDRAAGPTDRPGSSKTQHLLAQGNEYLAQCAYAKAEFEKVLRIAPRHAEALVGMAHVARAEGRFAEAEALLKRVLETDPNMPVAWAALVGLRKMTPDGAWLQRAQDIAASGIAP